MKGGDAMADRVTVGIRMDEQALARLDALCAKLGLNRTAVMLLALARLAEAESVLGKALVARAG
jgi:antitoxin component of RelBE/YafQ-DinJ toxin-antitoxin module